MRLEYTRYKGLNNIITIDLHNGFSVIAISSLNYDTGNYEVELHLKDNQISDWKLIEDAEKLEFKTDGKRINSAILKQVATFLNDGFFDKYIERYEYEIKCFDKGNELFEAERLGENNVWDLWVYTLY